MLLASVNRTVFLKPAVVVMVGAEEEVEGVVVGISDILQGQ